MSPPRFSIVVPVYNEAAVLRELIERCMATGQGLGDPFELIVVNDGSTDSTGEIARSLSQDGLEVLDLARNGGQFQATVQGVRAATGVWVAVLDGDLQDPPETLAALVKRAHNGPPVEVVFAIKERRTDPLWMRLGSWLYHQVQRATGTPLPRGAGSFCLMNRRLADQVGALRWSHLNLSVALARLSRSWTTVPYAKAARREGQSRVGLWGLIAEALGSWWISGALSRLVFVSGSLGALCAAAMWLGSVPGAWAPGLGAVFGWAGAWALRSPLSTRHAMVFSPSVEEPP